MNTPNAIAGRQTPPRTSSRAGYFLAFLFYLAVHLFIFRGIIVRMPDLLAGNAVLNTSELVPFFDPSEQFLEQAGGSFSDLTNEYEFRVRYSILTTWMRYYLVLPFAIVLSPLIGAYGVFLAVTRFLVLLLPSIPRRRILAATALTTLLIHLILLPAKITHFYTLILGFDLFVIALTFLVRGLLLEHRHPLRFIAGACLVALVNPTVHFLVLFPITVVFLCFCVTLLLLIARRGQDQEGAPQIRTLLWKRILPALCLLGTLTILPYGLFVKFFVLNGMGNLKDTIPDTYQAIRDSSLSLLYQTTFDQSSATEFFLRGTYIPASPRWGKLFYFLLLLVPFVLPFTRDERERRRLSPLLALLALLTLFAMWSSIGYADTLLLPTFHGVLAAVFRRLTLAASSPASMGMQLIAEVIHVLRNPDRFQFIYLAGASLLMPLGILALIQRCAALLPHRPRLRGVNAAVCAALFFLPLFAHWEYRSSLLTGDFGGFLRPYSVGHLRAIKEAIHALPRGKTIVLPSSESQLMGRTDEGGTYRFIDKFYIYFLDIPSFYFGLSGSLENKVSFFLLYQSLAQNERGWINMLRNLNVRYVIVNKELFAPLRSAGYLRNITQSIIEQPKRLPQFFTLRAENAGFALYEFTDTQQKGASPLLIDTDWRTYMCLQRRELSYTDAVHAVPLSSAALAGTSSVRILGEDRQKTRLDLYAIAHPESFVRPDPSLFAFSPDILSSSYYFGVVFPMLHLLSPSSYNLFRIMMPGPFDTLSATFVGLRKPTTVRFPVVIPENGAYAVFLRAAATDHALALRVDDGPTFSVEIDRSQTSTRYVTAQSAPFGTQAPADLDAITRDELAARIPKDIMPMSDRFDYLRLGTFNLEKGKRVLFLTKNDDNPLIAEGVLLLPVQKVEAIPRPPTGTVFVAPSLLPLSP